MSIVIAYSCIAEPLIRLFTACSPDWTKKRLCAPHRGLGECASSGAARAPLRANSLQPRFLEGGGIVVGL